MCSRLREIDPIHDAGWLDLVERHPRASVFHTPGWLEALSRTYGYEPVVLTASTPPREVASGVVFCHVASRLTGHRLVSLPFSDHCEPLVESNEELRVILAALGEERSRHGWKYIEMRPFQRKLSDIPGLTASKSYCLHRLDLQPTLAQIFRRLQKDCVQRKIQRAERAHLTYEEGASPALLDKFYRLLVMTRRRQLLLPQPIAWFRNLIECMGDKLRLHVVSNEGYPVASLLTIRHKATLVYKYGCSDRKFSNLGGMQLGFWKAIQQAKERGLEELDMGRSDWDDAGLIAFKDRWGATPSSLTYWRHGSIASGFPRVRSNARFAKPLFDRVPSEILVAMGGLLYRHAG